MADHLTPATSNPDLISLLAEADANAFGMARRHIRIGQCFLYLRIGPRRVGDELVRCLQIGTADVEPARQRQGHFKAALAELKALGLPIFVEGAQNIEWANALVARHGFRVLNSYMDGLVLDLFHPAESG